MVGCGTRLSGFGASQIGDGTPGYSIGIAQVQIIAKATATIATATKPLRGRAVLSNRLRLPFLESKQSCNGGAARIRLETYEARRSTAENRLSEKQKRLDALSPERLLERGYSVSRTADGRLIRSVADVQVGDIIHTQVRDGIVQSRIEESNG